MVKFGVLLCNRNSLQYLLERTRHKVPQLDLILYLSGTPDLSDPKMLLARPRFNDRVPENLLRHVTGRQVGYLPNMIQPPLLGVVNAARAVSARTLTCRAPAVPRRLLYAVGVQAVRRHPLPKLPPLEENGPSTLISPA